MKGRLVIEYRDDCQRIDYQFEEANGFDEDYDYVLWITLPRGRDINTTKIKLGLNKYLLRKLNGKTYQRDFPERVEILKKAYSEGVDLFDSCSKIEMIGHITEQLGNLFSDKNKKKIIKDGVHPLTLEEVERLERKYPDTDNIYFYVEENVDPISLVDYRQTTEKITKVVSRIKEYGFSPLEAAIYAYDYARDKIYTEEDKKDKFTESRDLTNALLRDKIVCVGYARIFKIILNKIGINASVYAISNIDGGHAIAVAHIVDEKYGIDGIYYFDPTRDRKRDDTDNHYNTYSAFAMTRGSMLNYSCYEDKTFGPLDEEEYKRVISLIQSGGSYNTYRDKTYTYISNIYDFLAEKSVYEDNEQDFSKTTKIKTTPDMATKIDECCRLLSQRIEPTKKLDALARVRRVEYYENSEKYPFSSQTIKTITEKSSWYYDDYADEKSVKETLREKANEYDRDAKGIDLVKVLRKVRDNKISEPK